MADKARTKTSLNDLNEILFEQLERMSNDELKGEELQEEINRSQAMCGITMMIIKNAEVVVKAAKLKAEYEDTPTTIGKLIEVNE